MCRKDRNEKCLEAYPDVLADLYNVLVFGDKVIQPENLMPGPTEAIYKADTGDLKESRRDVSQYYMDGGRISILLCVENQTNVDKDMPIRVMGYDYTSYKAQLVNGKERYPVITIVLNFDNKRWNKPVFLKSAVGDYGAADSMIQDYKIHVYDVAYLPDEVREKFVSDFRVIADVLSDKRTGRYIRRDYEIKHVEAVLDMLRIFTGDEKYGEITEEIMERKRKGEKISMCTFIDHYIEEGRAIGVEQGIEKGIEKGRQIGIEEGIEQGGVIALFKVGYSADMISDTLELSKEAVEGIIASCV